MRDLRRPLPRTRDATRRELEEAMLPRRHAPLKPGTEEERPVAGLPHLQRFEVVSSTDD